MNRIFDEKLKKTSYDIFFIYCLFFKILDPEIFQLVIPE